MASGSTTRLLTAAALLAGALVASAAEDRASLPDGVAQEIASRATARHVPADAALAPVREAAARGVPVELVAGKVLEGLAKGAPVERIAAVARALTERLAVAGALLDDGRAAGLAPAADRAAAQADLAAALADGVAREDVRELLRAARPEGSVETATVAARVMGELARRGVPPGEALGLGRALARRGGRASAGEVGGLFDSWRAEGGREPRAFLDEATRRIDRGRGLDGMVDVFADSPDRVVRRRGEDGARADPTASADGEPERHGASADHGAAASVPGSAKGKEPPGQAKGKH